MASASWWEQVRLFLWRNKLLKTRDRRNTMMELMFPLVFFFILVMLKFTIPSKTVPAMYDPDNTLFPVSDLNYVLKHAEGDRSLLLHCSMSPDQVSQSQMASVMKVIRSRVDEQFAHMIPLEPLSSCDMLNHNTSALAAVAFSALNSTHAHLILRIPGDTLPSSTEVSIKGQDDWQKDDSFAQYSASGFLALQSASLSAILNHPDGGLSGYGWAGNDTVLIAPCPTAAYEVDYFAPVFKNIGSLYFVIGFFPIVSKLLQLLVREKELRSLQAMLMMGLRPSVAIFGWWLTYLFIITPPVVILSVGSSVFGLFSGAESFKLFILTFAYLQSLIALAFCMSNFFDKSKTAGQMGGLFIFMLFLPQYALKSDTPSGAVGAACISSPIAFSQGFKAAHSPDETSISYGFAVLMCLFDACLYAMIAWYSGKVLPSEYGTRLPWYFPFTSRYWCGKRRQRKDGFMSIKDLPMESSQSLNADAAEFRAAVDFSEEAKAIEDGAIPAVSIKNLRKQWGNDVLAIEDLSLDMYAGEIFALLGHNGAGKSTAIGILTGLYEATSGDASIFGDSASVDMERIRENMGVCPQHDILWPELTVLEHLIFFAVLRGIEAPEAAARQKAAELELTFKLDERADTLSGGMKRKLSLCIALIGDSKFLCLDECTAGLDPGNRRQVWALLKKYRPGRVIIMTTHFLDEADLLGDRIAILARGGRLRCIGSSLELKTKFGKGYFLEIDGFSGGSSGGGGGGGGGDDDDGRGGSQDEHKGNRNEEIERAVMSHVPGSTRTEGGFMMPIEQVPRFADLFERLDADGVEFGVSLSSLESVFLALADEDIATEQLEKAKLLAADDLDENGHVVNVAPGGHYAARADENARLLGGHAVEQEFTPSTVSQCRGMLAKRWLTTIRNKRGLFFQFVFPIAYMFVLMLVTHASTLGDGDAAGSDGLVHHPAIDLWPPPSAYRSYDVAFGVESPPFDDAAVKADLKSAIPFEWLHDVVQVADNSYNVPSGLLKYAETSNPPHSPVLVGMATDDFNTSLLFVNVSAPHAAPVMLSVLANTGNPSMNIRITSHPLPFKQTETNVNKVSATGITTAIFAGIAFAYVPISWIISIVRERQSGAKHLQQVMGVRTIVYWGASALFDIGCFLLCAIAAIILFVAFSQPVVKGVNTIPTIVLFLCFGFQSITQVYLLSFAFSKAIAAQQALSMVNSIGSIVAFFVCLAVQEEDFVGPLVAHAFAAVAPPFVLMWGLFRLSIAAIIRDSGDSSVGLGTLLSASGYNDYGVGSICLVSIASGVLYAFGVYLADTGVLQCAQRSAAKGVEEDESDLLERFGKLQPPEPDDEDVAAERARVESGRILDDSIVVQKVSKLWPGAEWPAVYSLSLGVPRGECFALLGPNGAGKSTSMSVLTGDVKATDGDAFLDGASVTKQLQTARESLGFCPQHDGLIEMMTGREHLRMYARLKGVPEGAVLESCVTSLMERLTLMPFADRQAQTYSGGNKRKLSLAIALIGAPHQILLDEPSTGMDPQAKRKMWDVIRSQLAGRGVILTTHSMEEADALAGRIGIMVRGQMRCVGSAPHLKGKYGASFQVEIQLKAPPSDAEHVGAGRGDASGLADDDPEVDAVHAFVGKLIDTGRAAAESYLLEQFGGRLRYALPKTNVSLTRLFRQLSEAQHRLNIEHFSVSQTSLEQVFLEQVKSHGGLQ